MLRIVSSDWHVIDGRPTEPCDRTLVRRLVDAAVSLRVAEVILAGDIIDLTRGGDGCIPAAAAFLGEAVGRPLASASIYCTYIFGNHDWYGAKRASLVCQACVAAGFDPLLFRCSTGPEIRGAWQIEHGHRFDPWNRGGFLSHLARAATRVDSVTDRVGIELEYLNPHDWHPGVRVPELDLPAHEQANRWAATFGKSLVFGHTHAAGDVGGSRKGANWRVLNTGACTQGDPFTYVTIRDDCIGRVVY